MFSFFKNLNSQVKHLHNRYLHYLDTKEAGIVGRQRLVIFIYSSLIILLAVPINLLGLSGPGGTYFYIQNSIHFLLTVLFAIAYFTGKLSIVRTLSCLFILSQIANSMEMIYCAFNPNHYHLMLIVGDTLIAMAIVFLTLAAYLRITPYIVNAITMLTFIFCAYITQDYSLNNFIFIFAVIFLAVCIIGYHISNKSLILQRENLLLKSYEESIFDMFNMTKQQFDAYLELSRRKDLKDEKKLELFEALGDEVRENLYHVVSSQLRQEHTQEKIIENIFSNLTPSEREICQLILQDKTTGEICEILGKSSSNITSQRTHIRNKLGLKPEDNLRTRLIEIMHENRLPI